MSESGTNSWSRPWTTDQIIENSSNWSLAGDAGLLKYLESFSQAMLAKAEETNNNLNKLLEDLDSTSLSLNTAKNEFCSLRNVQFVESRVYEEDETLVLKRQQEEVTIPKPTDEEKKKEIREAVLKGINVVEKYFEKVEVPDSDSEDETDFPNFVLRPKDPYIDRPLPYVIGTEQWHKKWHVGLLDTSSESEADKVSEKFSDSDSESDLPVSNRNYVKGTSISGSEVDLSARNNINPVANSTFDEATKPDLFGSSDSEDYNSVPVQVPISSKTFAQELAAKLGDVIEQNMHVPEPEVNKRPIQAPPTSTRIIGNLFSDEPPPIAEENDMFGQRGSKGIFSGGGLFNDLEGSNRKENTIPPKEAPKPTVNLFDDEEDEAFLNVAKNPTSKMIRGGLFDDDSSEDDLFKETKLQTSLLHPNKVTMPFFSNEPPELEPKSSEPLSKKPVGGVKLFRDASVSEQQKINRILKLRQESSESSEREETAPLPERKPRTDQKQPTPPEKPPIVDRNPPEITSIPNKQIVGRPKKSNLFDDEEEAPSSIKKDEQIEEKLEKPKQISLFDDEDDLFEKDLFSAISTKKFTSSLFDDDSFKDDLFETLDSSKSSVKTPENEPPLDKTKQEKPSVISTLEEPPKDTQAGREPSRPSEPPKDSQKPSEPSKEKGLKVSLFSDESDEGDDLFSSINLSKNEIQSEAGSGKEGQGSKRANIVFFDENPPEDDEEWDTKSDNLFEENDHTLFDNIPEVSIQRSGLFDNEPPSIFSESSGIVKDASTRVEPDESFNPYASSSRRYSTDIFNEQQSNDSFFVTKSKSGIEPAPALRSIPEFTSGSLSNTEITPSGNPDDLFSDSSRPLESGLFGSGLPQDEKSEKSRKIEPDDLFSDSAAKPFESDLFSSSQKEEKVESQDEKRKAAEEERIDEPKSEVGDEKAQAAESAEPVKRSPGKLKHNLNINVAALIPGAALPKKKDVDSPSFEAPPSLKSPEAKDQDSSYHTPSENLPGPGEAEVLPSITKDRARIPVKRRPSTRKARQESIRKSGVDFQVNPEPEKGDSSGTPESSIFEEFDSSKEPPSLKADSLKTDLSKTSFLFDSPDSDNSLFGESSASKTGSSEKNPLFGDDSRASEPKPREDPLFGEESRSGSSQHLFDEQSRSSQPRPRRDDGKSQSNEPRKGPLFGEGIGPDDSLFGRKIGTGGFKPREDSLFGEESRPSQSKPRKDLLFGQERQPNESKPRTDPLFGQENQPSESKPRKDPLFVQESQASELTPKKDPLFGQPSESKPRKDPLFGQESQPSESKPIEDPFFGQESQPSEPKPRKDPLFGQPSQSKPRTDPLFGQEGQPSEPNLRKDTFFGQESQPSEPKPRKDPLFGQPRKDPLFGQESQPSESKPIGDPFFGQESQPSEPKLRKDPLFGQPSQSKPRTDPLFGQERQPSEPNLRKDPFFGQESQPSEPKPRKDPLFGQPRKDPLFGQESQPSEPESRKDSLFGQPSESKPRKDPLFGQESQPSELESRKDPLFGQPRKDPLFGQQSQPSEPESRKDLLFGQPSESKPRKDPFFGQESQASEAISRKDPLFSEESRPGESKRKDYRFMEESRPVEPRPKQKEPELPSKSGLFDDDDFGDLFSSKKLPPKSTVPKKSLFDDDVDDDDDIFGSSVSARSTSKSVGEAQSMQKKTVKTAQVKKLENTAAEDDPLSSFYD